MPTLPPIPGSPWLLRSLRLRDRKAAPTTAPPSAVPYRVPAITLGPPIPGAPWFTRALTFPKARPTPTGPTPGPLPVPTGRLSPVLPFLPRVPDIEGQAGKDQLRRFTEILSSAFNSLVGQGILVQTGQATWSINAAALSGTPVDDDFAFLVGHGPPASASGEAGDRYIDLDTGDFYWRD